MINARATRRVASPRSVRAQRSAAAAVAEYIHELSGRHAGAQSGDAGDRRPRAGSRISASDLIAQGARQALGGSPR
jgi:hypothetical protein